MLIQMFSTYVSPQAAEYVAKVIGSTYLSEGKIVQEFENKLSDSLGIMDPVALNSGTSALHLAVVLAGVRSGDEVVCSAQTFVATAMVIAQERAVPVFADIDYKSGNLDPKSLETKVSERTKAVIAVHWGGYPCDMDAIHAIARKYNLAVIEDAAHAPGATYHGKPIGTLSDFTCFSFQAIKHITTGDGGALCCMNPDMRRDAFRRRWFSIDRISSPLSSLGERVYDIDQVGYKYHMNDYAAALGLANLNDFAERLARRRKIASYYRDMLNKIPGVSLFESSPDRESAYWLFGMHVERRDDFIKALQSRDIASSVVHLGIDHNTLFGGTRHDLVNQLKFNRTQIHIPLHDGLSDDDVAHIVKSVAAGW